MTTTGCFIVPALWTKRHRLQRLTNRQRLCSSHARELGSLGGSRLAQTKLPARSASSLCNEYSENDVMRHEQGRNPE